MKDPNWDRPVGDDRLWLKNKAAQIGWPYCGKEPDKFSPATRQEEEKNLRDVVYGRRFPRTQFERDFLRYMGGIQEEPPRKWRTCQGCSNRFEAGGFPAPGGGALYPDVCYQCADRMDAGFWTITTTSSKARLRSVYND